MSPIPPGGCSSGSGGSCSFGLFAGRPTPGAAGSCGIYVATDTGDTYISDGSAWYIVGGSNSFSYTSPQIVTAVNYAALVTDRVILLNAPSLAVTLPAGATSDTLLHIKDYAGVATASPHTITPAFGDTIDFAASIQLNVNYMNLTIGYRPADSNWVVL